MPFCRASRARCPGAHGSVSVDGGEAAPAQARRGTGPGRSEQQETPFLPDQTNTSCWGTEAEHHCQMLLTQKESAQELMTSTAWAGEYSTRK
ncbi:hypothetical protein NDU88_000766 [Pleurodeles waltl]|uniref:Uncharacterized protein n=1 Tax=Pleurodeles waltl TaxID=8319 RepID=A0AAV7KMT3_PLEWA|nr:hypothetical protein NDU88_000766 [Pleurodeles waltl]